MAQPTYSLTWDLHKNNLCTGISDLQQHGEFVDMTLAADGHLVKVHQMILSLASPYMKELIKSVDCQHPVIVLNNISYFTLSAILEYIYTGEVLISVEHLSELLKVAKELRIKGLENMKVHQQPQTKTEILQSEEDGSNTQELEDDICYFEIAETTDTFANSPSQISHFTFNDDGIPEECHIQSPNPSIDDAYEESTLKPINPNETPIKMERVVSASETSNTTDMIMPTSIQYTVSNQGSLQMIVNRYIYYLKHRNRSHMRHWRCVDYLNPRKCPAIVVTNKEDMVIQRISAHTHPFHDKRILKKVHSGAVFTALHEAEQQGASIKTKREALMNEIN